MHTSSITVTDHIMETSTIADVLPYIDQDTWLLLDLDNTLFQATQALGHVNWLLDQITKLTEKGMSYEDALHSMYPLWKKTQMITAVMPVEAALIETILELQDKGIVVLGVTRREPFLMAETLRQVHSLKIDFLKSAPCTDSFDINLNHRAVYYEGILFVDSFNEKSEVFYAFLQRLSCRPKKIIFLDDKKSNVEEFAHIMNREEIQYIGVHYTAAERGTQIYSPELAALQFSLLDKILSNSEAQTMLNQSVSQTERQKLAPLVPDYVYKIVSITEWRTSLHQNSVIPSSLDQDFIHLATTEQLIKVVNKFWSSTDHVILKISSNQLIGRLIYESNPGGSTKYFHLYDGFIPLHAVVEASIRRIASTEILIAD